MSLLLTNQPMEKDIEEGTVLPILKASIYKERRGELQTIDIILNGCIIPEEWIGTTNNMIAKMSYDKHQNKTSVKLNRIPNIWKSIYWWIRMHIDFLILILACEFLCYLIISY